MNPTQGMQEMMMALRGLKLSAPKQDDSAIMRRPGLGAAGRKILLLANHFPVACTIMQAFQYDVSIEPMKDGQVQAMTFALPKKLCIAVIVRLAGEQQWPVGVWSYDRAKNIYAAVSFLPNDETSWLVQIPEDDRPNQMRTFKVTTKMAGVHDIREVVAYHQRGGGDVPRAGLQALDIALRHTIAMRATTFCIGRGLYFDDPDSNFSLGGGATAYQGQMQSLRLTQSGLTLNVDVAFTPFNKSGPLVEVIVDILNMRGPQDLARGIQPRDLSRLTKALRGLRVRQRVGTNVRKHTIRGVSSRPADQEMFVDAAGKRISVADYFNAKLRALAPPSSLRFPKLPCVDVTKRSKDLAKKDKIILLPPELCFVTPGQRKAKMDEQQTRKMVTEAAMEPAQRKEQIDFSMQLSDFGADPVTNGFGLDVQQQMMKINGRVLPSPKLAYGQPQCVDVGGKGAWNLVDVKFPRAPQGGLHSFAFVSLMSAQEVDLPVPNPSGIRTFIQDLLGMLVKTGIEVANRNPPLLFAAGGEDFFQLLTRAKSEAQKASGGKPTQMLFVCLPDKNKDRYAQVKRVTDGALGVVSQCFVAVSAGLGRNQPKGRPQYCANLALKVNAKLGGLNVHLLGEPTNVVPVVGGRPFMVFGADVTHPRAGFRASGEAQEPSVAAVVGSLDKYLGRYACRVSLQYPDKGKRAMEYLVNLKAIVRELLMEFYHYNAKKKPEALLFYRDGVAEGQFEEVFNYEYAAIKDAIREFGDPTFHPPVTFVIVQKRHNTKLFCADQRDTVEKSGNVPPGVVVDSDICHPAYFDFYLNSHAGLKGTSRPAHYHVLVDQNGFGPDGLQMLTYWMCYLYCRCTRSVSVCPPAYYAHLAAFRGRIMRGDAESGSDVSGFPNAPVNVSISAALNNVMFYV